MLLEFLLITAGVGALTWWRARAQSRRRWAEAWRQAIEGRNWARLEQLSRALLPYASTPLNQARLRLALSHALLSQDRPVEAVEVLDPSLAAELPAREMATWLNNRGYMLALTGRLDEAEDELERAEIIVGDDEELDGRFLQTCVLGNRGVIQLRRGQLAEAEALIERAHSLTLELLEIAPADNVHARESTEWQAERFFWLAEVAEKRGDGELARTRLAESARLEGTRYGAKARKLLTAG